ncbi:MAG: hypothetical protein WC829_01160 [Hyphomicrobium sp.]|jgi:hypothetical protein
MSLVERLEKLAKEQDRARWKNYVSWNGSSYAYAYDCEAVENSNLLSEAAKRIRELEAKCPT